MWQSPFPPVKQGLWGRHRIFSVLFRLVRPFPVNCRSPHEHWVFAVPAKFPASPLFGTKSRYFSENPQNYANTSSCTWKLWYIPGAFFAHKRQIFRPEWILKMSTLHIRCSSYKKIKLLNVYKKTLIPTFGLCNIHISLLLEDGNGTKCWYTQKPCKIGRSAILKPNRKPESHNHVTNPMFHFYCILSTIKQWKSKKLLCSFTVWKVRGYLRQMRQWQRHRHIL